MVHIELNKLKYNPGAITSCLKVDKEKNITVALKNVRIMFLDYFFKKNLDLNAKATYKYLGINSKANVGSSSYANSGDQNSLVLDGLIWSAGFSWYF